MPDRICFRLNREVVTVETEVPATTTLLRWLRARGLTGTKEGCNEGDCGACTIVLENVDGGRTPINACLAVLGQLHGKSVRTVEGLSDPSGVPHPVQTTFAEANATQCGFCTPGFIMAAWAYTRTGGDPHEALAGNLCRCTGYRPIIDALASLERDTSQPEPPMGFAAEHFETDSCSFFVPGSMTAALELRVRYPTAILLAGGTDLGLAFAEGRGASSVISLLNIPELQCLQADDSGLTIGACAPFERVLAFLREESTSPLGGLIPLMGRFGSRQIRGLGTIGGNLASASPIGDMLPALLSLEATVNLRSSRGVRVLAVREFLLGYRRNALESDEIIESLHIDRIPPGVTFVCEKLSRRWDQDISAVSAAFYVKRENGFITDARLSFGGMGPVAARAPKAESALIDAPWSQASLNSAAAKLTDDFTPLTDARGTAAYREQAAIGLLHRLWWRVESKLPSLEAL